MKPAYTLLALGFVALTATVSAGPLDDPHTSAPPAIAQGIYAISFQPNSPATVPSGTTLTCKAKVVPTLPGAAGRDLEPVSGVGTPGGCLLQLPYAWTSSQTGASLSYEVDAVSANGAVVRSTGPQAVSVSAPPAGGTARVNLSISF